jgi:ubiquinone/menaquinone biosynthesis C-methylase UbiE
MGVYWAEIADKNQTERQIQFLKSQLKPGGFLLDVACGTGRHTIPLSVAGFSMIGLDASPHLLKIAKQRDAVLLVKGDMRFLPFKAGTFSAAISMDTSFGYLPSEKDDAKSLAEIRRVLRKDGKLVVDVFNRKNLAAKYQGKTPAPKWIEYPDFFLHQKRTVSNRGNWLCDSWEIHDKPFGHMRVFKHSVRLYERSQLEGLLAEAGFKVQEVFGGYEGQEFSAEAPQLILLANAE